MKAMLIHKLTNKTTDTDGRTFGLTLNVEELC